MDKIEVMETIGDNLRKIRLERGYTQEHLSELVGISTSFYANIERGKKGMSIFVLQDLANALGVSTDYLLNKEREGKSLDNIEMLLKDVPQSFLSSIEHIIRACKEEFIIAGQTEKEYAARGR